MVDEGNIRIRSTGRVNTRHRRRRQGYRTVTATFRRAGFLDFLYYTDLENQDPTYIQRTDVGAGQPGDRHQRQPDRRRRPADVGGRQVPAPLVGHAGQRRRGPPAEAHLAGAVPDLVGRLRRRCSGAATTATTTWTPTTSAARSPSSPATRSTARSTPTTTSWSAARPGSAPRAATIAWRSRVPGSGPTYANPQFNPTLRTGAAELDPPATNQSLEAVADPGYAFDGQHHRSCCRERP